MPFLGLAASIVSAAAVSAPTITTSAVLTHAGAQVVVRGAGFGRTQPIAITLDGAGVGTARTSAKGALTVAVRIPSAATLGDHELRAAGAGGAAATAAMVVVAPLRGRLVNIAFQSRALLGTMHASVYLPPGYATSHLSYPTIYFLHGLPADASAYSRRARPVSQLVEALGKAALVVFPQGARDRDSDPEYADWGSGRNWEHAVAVELPTYVDRRFRTIRNRSARAIVGVSAGGYGATICALHHLGTFSVIQSWSGYFRPTDPTGTHVIGRGSPQADAAASVFAAVPHLASAFASKPTQFSFYVGNGDAKFRSDNVTLDAELTAAKVAHEFRLYPGGHTWFLWDAHAEEWLGAALADLVPPH